MKKIVLLSILILAAILRFDQLGDYPALNADEASIGYNAYSLLETGKDEHGNPWPIHFQSFNDYKPGLYFYLVLPFVKVLGVSELAVRLPGAVLGVAAVLLIYLAVREIFKDERLAILSGILLALSPWHLHFSRGGWEVNLATFLITLGVWLFYKALKNPKYYVFSIISFVLSLYAYHAARIVAPLLLLILILTNLKGIKQKGKTLLIAVVIGVLLILPLVRDFTKGAVVSRAAGVGLFSDPGPLSRINEQRGEHNNFQSFSARLLHNKAVNYGLAFAQNWMEHYWGEFLFLSGDEIERNRVPETGQLHLFELLFILVGLAYIAKNSKGWGIILSWLLVSPFAASLTFQSPHALRAQNMVIPLTIISAFGLTKILDWGKEKRWVLAVVILIMIWGVTRYLHMYYVHMAKEYPFSSQYGVKELVSYVSENQGKYQKIWVSDRYDQPYILFLFYLKYPPDKFQKDHVLTGRDKFGFSTVRDFDEFHFEEVNFDKIRPENPNSLIVGTDEEIPTEANIVKKIFGSNSYLYFEIVAN
ncbi:MAG: ArnT family glycosyltransferase [Patescibacteria group bacterium]